MTFTANPEPVPPTVNGRYAPTSAGLNGHGRPLSLGAPRTTISVELASWLLAHEMGVDQDSAALARAAERVGQKIASRLARMVSITGSRALVSRALHLVRGQFHFLEGVRAGTEPGAYFERLDECVRDVEPGDVRAGLLAVLAAVLELLFGFVGEDLTLRLLLDVWPDLLLREPRPPATSAG